MLAGSRAAHLSRKPKSGRPRHEEGVAVESSSSGSPGKRRRRSPRAPSIARRTSAPTRRRAARHRRQDRQVVFGPLHPDVIHDALDLDGPAQIVELDLATIEGRSAIQNPNSGRSPRLPATSRDVAIVASRIRSRLADRTRAPRGRRRALPSRSELFDVFTGGHVPDGSRSLAYRVVYRDPKATSEPDKARTLTDAEVDRQHERVRAAAQRLGELRS